MNIIYIVFKTLVCKTAFLTWRYIDRVGFAAVCVRCRLLDLYSRGHIKPTLRATA
jgi:hypothetical protein